MFDAIVLAGGAAARLGGADKPALDVGGASLLDRVLAAVAEAGRIVVVGPTRSVARPVIWCREEPPGGGPVAALAAGVSHVEADVLLSLAADLPWIGPAVPVLCAALAGSTADCAALVDGDGRVNYLAAAWRRASLVRALTALDEPAGAAMRALVSTVTLLEVPDEGGWGLDCDTWDDIDGAVAGCTEKGPRDDEPAQLLAGRVGRRTRRRLQPRSTVTCCSTSPATRRTASPAAAAPLTTFLVGLAAGLNGGSVEAIRAPVSQAADIAVRRRARAAPPAPRNPPGDGSPSTRELAAYFAATPSVATATGHRRLISDPHR